MDKKEGKNNSKNNGAEEIKKEEKTHKCGNYGRGINFGSIFLGFLLVLGGLIYFAQAFGLLRVRFSFQWEQLWPLLIILAGLSLFSGRNWISAIIGAVVTLLVVALVALIVLANLSI